MIRYVLSLLVFFAGFYATILISGDSILNLLWLPSFIAVGIIPFLFVSVLFGFKNTASAFSSAVKKETEKENLLKAVEFFNFYGKITWIAALIAVILGIVSILANLEDTAMLGPNVALALISLLYGGLINALLILPFAFLLKKQLADRG
jgi:flagellar motor component MotA